MNRLSTLTAILILLAAPLFAQVPCDKSQLCPAGGGGATFSYVGGATAVCNTAVTCPVTYSPTNGNLIVVDIETADTTASNPPSLTTDNGTSTYSNAFASGQQAGSNYFNEDWAVAAGSPTAITANVGSATTGTTVNVREYHRTSGSWAFGGVPSTLQNFGTSATATCNAMTPTAGVPAIVSGMFINQNANAAFTSANSTIRVSVYGTYPSTQDTLATGDQIVASASGPYTPSATLTSNSWRCFGSWFK